MSIKIMSQVWESDLPPTERFVLLCLADHADDQRRTCYPSVRRLVARTGFSERAVQGALKRLRERGLLEAFRGEGDGGTTLYKITPPPAGDAPPQEMRPAGDAPAPPQEMRDTPAGDAPKPSGTVKEPPKVTFPEFWEVWPNKKNRPGAERAWKKLSAKDRHQATRLAASWFSAWRKASPDANAIHPASYLNGRRWEDEGSAPPTDIRQAKAEYIRRGMRDAVKDYTRSTCRELLDAGLVTTDQLKAVGLEG